MKFIISSIKNILNKINKFFINLLYSIPFGIKGGNDLLLSQNTEIDNNLECHKEVHEERLSKSLLKGEVTTSVKELRYRDYNVYRQSKIIDKDVKYDINNLRIIQNNKLICNTLLEDFSTIDKYGSGKYTLQIVYKDFPKFRIEILTDYFEFSSKELLFTVHIGYDKTIPIKQMLINQLKKSTNNFNNVLSPIEFLSFITLNASGDVDLIQYNIYNLFVTNVDFTDTEIIIRYKVNYFERNDLIGKFYSETMDEKYKNNQKKDNVYYWNNEERKCYCSKCGKLMNVWDSDITQSTLGYSICSDCLAKEFEENKIILDKSVK